MNKQVTLNTYYKQWEDKEISDDEFKEFVGKSVEQFRLENTCEDCKAFLMNCSCEEYDSDVYD